MAMSERDRNYFADLLDQAAEELRNDAAADVSMTLVAKADCPPGRKLVQFDLNLPAILWKARERFCGFPITPEPDPESPPPGFLPPPDKPV